jgi:threonine dehydrogenase-like Zn-dependent dehydrogenase
VVGADDVIDTRETSVASLGARFAAVIECSGAPGAVQESIGVLEPGGRCVAVALSSEVVAMSVLGMVSDGIGILGSCAFDAAGYAAAVEHIAAWRVPVADIISERIGLREVPDMLTRLREPGDVVRVLAKPGL